MVLVRRHRMAHHAVVAQIHDCPQASKSYCSFAGLLSGNKEARIVGGVVRKRRVEVRGMPTGSCAEQEYNTCLAPHQQIGMDHLHSYRVLGQAGHNVKRIVTSRSRARTRSPAVL